MTIIAVKAVLRAKPQISQGILADGSDGVLGQAVFHRHMFEVERLCATE